ncbi:MAG: Rrf2 family transcriptional regulator [Actinobacteria bacterium]|nr:Rrf2 family transcriptional regulator [Actinomycetota bacterium]
MAAPISTQFAMAVHVLVLLAQPSERHQTSETLSTSVGSNPVHLRRILGRLRKSGLVASRPGRSGGWVLLHPAEEVTLAEVWAACAGDQILGLHEANPSCEVGHRVHGQLLDLDARAREAIEAELERTTIADLISAAEYATVPR